MGIRQFFVYYLLRSLRYLLDLTTGFLGPWLSGPPDVLPALKDKILLQSATELARKIRKKEVRSTDLVKAVIRRSMDVQPFINAVVDDVYDDVLEAAKKVDDMVDKMTPGDKSEEELATQSPLLGVPLSVKEYIGVKGMYFSNGILSRKGTRADEDADVVKKLKDAGALVFVKTNVPEMSFSWDTANLVYGKTRNPYDTRRMPGGSSGGEGALLAAGGSIIGIGSDLGGSIRVPAAMNGVFGHKPTAGVVPDTGTYPPLPKDIANFFSNLGPLCRYAADLRTMMKILAPQLDFKTPVDLSKITVYYCVEAGDNPLLTPVTTDVKARLKKVVKHLEDKYEVTTKEVHIESLQDGFPVWGHAVIEAGLPPVEEFLSDGKGKTSVLWELLKYCLGYSAHSARLLFMIIIFKFFQEASSETKKNNLKKLRHLKAQFNNILKENCVFLYPTQPEAAPYSIETYTKVGNVTYTCIFNALGYPVTHVPLGLSQGMPIGIQVIANSNYDNLTISVAEELEKAFGGWVCPSPVS